MPVPYRRPDGPGPLRFARRPGRLLVAVVTMVIVVALAAAVPSILGGHVQTAQPTPTDALSATAASTAVSSFPPPAVTPVAVGPSPSMTASSSFVPLSPPPARIGIEAKRIRIDRLGIDLPIVEGDGVDAPLHKAAHYPGTAWPRGGSNIYIYGHAQQGMFLSLWEAKVGDEVVLDLADGTQAVYTVAEVIPKARWNDLSLLEPTSSERLTLQTSTSNTATAPRFVVIARPTS